MAKNNSRSFSSVVANPSSNIQKQHRFAEVPSVSVPRSTFDRSHGLKTTFNAMGLIPVLVDEALPGDTFECSAVFLARMATPIKPVMDNMWLSSYFFFVPYRLIWQHWVNFCGEQANPGDSIAFTIPQIASPVAGYANQTIFDYMGLPTKVAAVYDHSALPFRAYNLIFNQWFKDENLDNNVVQDFGDGPDLYTDYALLSRRKAHDYFTSALPFVQKGTAASIPLGTSAPLSAVAGTYTTNVKYVGATSATDYSPLGQAFAPSATAFFAVGGTVNPSEAVNSNVPITGAGVAPLLSVNLASATAATINALRLAFTIQQFLELDARGGTRYIEKVLAHFGVQSPDARLQRAEYLGGGKTRVGMIPVAQSSVSAATPQGNLAGYSVTAARGHGFRKSFTEHGVILGLVCVTADLTYQYGIEKQWLRSTEYDFYWPTFANLGEQSILNMEIYTIGGAGGQDQAVFGYQERYAEYRYKPSKVTGQFRSNDAVTLDLWHLADKYTALPVLNSTWISAAPPMARVEAVSGGPDFLMDCHFSYRCTRPMPVYSVPGLTRL